MSFRYFVKSETGGFRKNNQDCAYAKQLRTRCGNAFLGVVCDGMGGLSHGEMASRLVADAFSLWFEEEFRYIMNSDNIADYLFAQWEQIIDTANSQLRKISAKMNCCMGTTLSVLLLFNDIYYAAQIGDSRIYQLYQDKIIQITTDHSLVSEMAQAGLMTENEMSVDSRRNILTRCIGVKESVCADKYTGDANGIFLLCTDGFYGKINGIGITDFFPKMPYTKISKRHISRIIKARIKLGEKDNQTALVVRKG